MTQDIDWSAIAPPLVLAVGAVVVLMVDAFAGPPRSRRAALVPATLTVLSVLVAAVPAVRLVGDPRQTFCVQRPLGGPVRCSFEVDQFTLVLWAVVLFGTAVVALIGTVAVADGRTPLGEWSFLLLSSATGALTIAAARDLVTLVVALEVVSLPAFAMVGLRRDDARAAEATVKFFLVSVISTAVTLMGVSLLYGATGSVFLTDIDAALPLDGALGRVTVTAG
ncbi:MAG TPA: proton-conducting transporter membrane subunit, partial [Actinomycetales bacterium]